MEIVTMSNTNKTDIWMPVYIGDYLSKTTRLSTEQHGAYLLLLMDYWKNGPPPDDDRVLAQITRMSEDAWSNAKSIVLAFFELSESKWIHSRVEKELQAADKRKQTAISRAQAGAQARWSKNTPSNNAPSNASSIPKAMLDPMLADASSPSPSSKRRSNKNHSVQKPPEVDEKVWQDYIATRKTALTETGLKQLQKEADLAGMTLEAAMSECVLRGWTGFKADWMKGKTARPLSVWEKSELQKQEFSDRLWKRSKDDGRTIDATPLKLG
jgi:uncharacterized protein YdaU (DUF1376 family)